MNRTRKVLLVSPQFPPSTLAGAHRVRLLSKHLEAHGWTPTVLTVEARDYAEALDDRLLRLVPETVAVRRVKAMPQRLARVFGVGDIGLRAYLPLRRELRRQLATGGHDLVFYTGFPFYPMLSAGHARRRGVPVVLDFQDPWVSDWGGSQKALSKPGLAHRLALFLEPRAIAHASGVMSVSAIQNAQMRSRYPHLAPDRFLSLPIGGDWDDFDALPPAADDGERRPVTFTGTFPVRAVETFRLLFRTLSDLRGERPALLEGVRFRFVGTSAVTGPDARPRVAPLAQEAGVADLVEEQPRRAPYLDALAEMRDARANLMIGSDEPHYTASRIFPTLMSGRPFLSLFHQDSSAHEILSRSGGGVALGFDPSKPLDALRPDLQAALERILARPESFPAGDRAVVAPYTSYEIARSCAAFFDRIVEIDARRSPPSEP